MRGCPGKTDHLPGKNIKSVEDLERWKEGFSGGLLAKGRSFKLKTEPFSNSTTLERPAK